MSDGGSTRMRRWEVCKVDYVQCVKEIISNSGMAGRTNGGSLETMEVQPIGMITAIFSEYGPLLPATPHSKPFDNILYWYIIIITDGDSQGRQTPTAPPTGCPAPPPRSGHRRTVPGQQLF